MVCHHKPGDPACGQEYRDSLVYSANEAESKVKRLEEKIRKLEAQLASTVDNSNYEIERMERFGPHIVVEVTYPSCAKCAFEGRKVLVIFDQTEAQVMRWKFIDPHFRPRPTDDELHKSRQAPPPEARFPATVRGWTDACTYAAAWSEL